MYVPGSNSARERLATAFRDAAKQAGSARPGRHCGLAQWIAPYPYDQMHVRDRFSPPNLHYLAGTDEYGRDVFSRLLFGSQLSLALHNADQHGGGCPAGPHRGYRRGVTDEAVMRVVDVMLEFPPIVLMLLILAVTPPSLMKTTIAIGILAVAPIARVTRSVTLDLMSGEFIEGGTRSRRAPALHADAGTVAHCLAAAGGGSQPARNVCRAAGCRPELPWLRAAARR